MKKHISFVLISLLLIFSFHASTFNDKLTDEEKEVLSSGKVIIRNIDFYRNICLDLEENSKAQEVKEIIHQLNPKYLAEIIQYKPYEGNENLPEILSDILYNVEGYAGIPYYSEHNDEYYNLYDSAKIVSSSAENDVTLLKVDFDMAPFGIVHEDINLETNTDYVVYSAVNTNKLRYLDKFDCVYPKKMKMCIFLFREGDKWVLYGIGGVNAPRIPFFTERIELSFINRIKTFCNFIFQKI